MSSFGPRIDLRRVAVMAICAIALLWPIPATPRPQPDTSFAGGVLTREFVDRVYQPDLCAKRCREASTTCDGWTYESPPPSAPFGTGRSVCRLYSGVSAERRATRRTVSGLAEDALAGEIDGRCMTSGLFPAVPELGTIDLVIDHPNPQSCIDICSRTARCAGWTYTRELTRGSPYRPRSCVFSSMSSPAFSPPIPGCLSGRRN